jgi:hypothetical protein
MSTQIPTESLLTLFDSFTHDELPGLDFAARIAARRTRLWSRDELAVHQPQECEHELLSRTHDLSRWRCCCYWQRKLSNKLNAKEFAAKYGANVAVKLWHGADPLHIPFSKLPDSYVLKLSNGSGSHQVIAVSHGKDLIGNSLVSPNHVIARLHDMLVVVDDPLNLIIVEEFIGNPSAGLPHDYKFFCFHGRVQIAYEGNRADQTLSWYDRTWTPVRDPMHTHRPRGAPHPPPRNLAQLIVTAETLAAAYQYPFVRIDLYDPDLQPTFGEFTHTPLSDELEGYTAFANRIMGLLWANPDLFYSEAIGDVSRRSDCLGDK